MISNVMMIKNNKLCGLVLIIFIIILGIKKFKIENIKLFKM